MNESPKILGLDSNKCEHFYLTLRNGIRLDEMCSFTCALKLNTFILVFSIFGQLMLSNVRRIFLNTGITSIISVTLVWTSDTCIPNFNYW